MFVFPRIISAGRQWFKSVDTPPPPDPSPDLAIPTEPADFDPVPAPMANQEPTKPPPPVEKVEGGAFDLFFLRWSLVVDASAAFVTQGWHIYLGKST